MRQECPRWTPTKSLHLESFYISKFLHLEITLLFAKLCYAFEDKP